MPCVAVKGRWKAAISRAFHSVFQVLDVLGEPGKNRTCDPLIKSQLLYRLSYGLSQERRNLVFDSAPVNAGIRPKSGCDALACRTPKAVANMRRDRETGGGECHENSD